MRGAEPRLKIHPLFFLAGICSAFTGRLTLFLLAVIAAVQHECAHAFAARRYGYTLDRLVLMPYGAVVSGDLSGIGRRAEISVLVAGPLANGLTALFFVALWWLFPETYPYTDAAAHVSFSLFLVNLLPAPPLDGGRIVLVLMRPLGEKRTAILGKILSLTAAAGIFGYFVYTCFSAPAFSALAFAAMLAFGAFGGGRYRRLSFSRDFSKGVEEERVAISSDCTVGRALRFLREDKYLVFILFEEGKFLAELTEEEFLAAVERGDYSATLAACIP